MIKIEKDFNHTIAHNMMTGGHVIYPAKFQQA